MMAGLEVNSCPTGCLIDLDTSREQKLTISDIISIESPSLNESNSILYSDDYPTINYSLVDKMESLDEDPENFLDDEKFDFDLPAMLDNEQFDLDLLDLTSNKKNVQNTKNVSCDMEFFDCLNWSSEIAREAENVCKSLSIIPPEVDSQQEEYSQKTFPLQELFLPVYNISSDSKSVADSDRISSLGSCDNSVFDSSPLSGTDAFYVDNKENEAVFFNLRQDLPSYLAESPFDNSPSRRSTFFIRKTPCKPLQQSNEPATLASEVKQPSLNTIKETEGNTDSPGIKINDSMVQDSQLLETTFSIEESIPLNTTFQSVPCLHFDDEISSDVGLKEKDFLNQTFYNPDMESILEDDNKVSEETFIKAESPVFEDEIANNIDGEYGFMNKSFLSTDSNSPEDKIHEETFTSTSTLSVASEPSSDHQPIIPESEFVIAAHQNQTLSMTGVSSEAKSQKRTIAKPTLKAPQARKFTYNVQNTTTIQEPKSKSKIGAGSGSSTELGSLAVKPQAIRKSTYRVQKPVGRAEFNAQNVTVKGAAMLQKHSDTLKKDHNNLYQNAIRKEQGAIRKEQGAVKKQPTSKPIPTVATKKSVHSSYPPSVARKISGFPIPSAISRTANPTGIQQASAGPSTSNRQPHEPRGSIPTIRNPLQSHRLTKPAIQASAKPALQRVVATHKQKAPALLSVRPKSNLTAKRPSASLNNLDMLSQPLPEHLSTPSKRSGIPLTPRALERRRSAIQLSPPRNQSKDL